MDFGAIFENILAFFQQIVEFISGLFGGDGLDLSGLFGAAE